mmetsp:Transcript_69723/g.194536  ORF Transcript_69723/g.194536 Transcript_69723/m.194536 type:complete len:84 (+) Transcript_69723:23-274(+)
MPCSNTQASAPGRMVNNISTCLALLTMNGRIRLQMLCTSFCAEMLRVLTLVDEAVYKDDRNPCNTRLLKACKKERFFWQMLAE